MSAKILKLPFFFSTGKKERKKLQGFRVDQDLTEFTKITMLESLKLYIY
jgi:hypothetical protein